MGPAPEKQEVLPSIKEIRDRKRALEAEITHLLREFNRETGLLITNLQVQDLSCFDFNAPDYNTQVLAVSIQLKL